MKAIEEFSYYKWLEDLIRNRKKSELYLTDINKDEKDIFDATFIDRLTDQEIIDKYKTYSKHITQVKKSAVIKFCLRSGLDKFVDVIK